MQKANSSIYKSDAGERAILAVYDSVLKNWPVEYQTITVPTRHGDTFVIAGGDESKPALILLHGSSSNATSWIADFPEYSRHFRVYAIDIPGDPGRSAPNRLPWNSLGYAEWLLDTLDGLKIEKTMLLGLSQGGWTALRFATCYPERVYKLALLTPGGIVPTKKSFLFKSIFYLLQGKRGVRKLNRYVAGSLPVHPDAMKFMDLIMTHFKARIDREYLFTDDELKRITMPVLLIGGTGDVIRSNEAIVRRLENLVPQLQSSIIPGMGHVLINMTQNILPFLKAGITDVEDG